MKIDLDAKILDLGGKDIPKDKEGAALTLRGMVISALVTALTEDQQDEAIKIFNRYELARKVKNHKNSDFEVEPGDADMIRKRIMKLYVPEAAGFAWELLKG